MPKKTTKKATARSSSPSGIRRVFLPEGLKSIWAGDSVRFITGLFILIIALFLLLSFSSHFFTGGEEQAGIQAGELENAVNYGGRLGAYVSYFFMDKCFGVSAYFIPVFLLALGVKSMRVYKVRLWKWFINCAFLMIWTSVTLGMVQCCFTFSNTSMTFYWGGLHGKDAWEYMASAIGAVPGGLVLMVVAIGYLVYLRRGTIKVVRDIMKPQEMFRHSKNGADSLGGPAGVEDNTDGNPVSGPADAGEARSKEDSYTVSLDFSNKVGDEKDPKLILDAPADSPDSSGRKEERGAEKTEPVAHAPGRALPDKEPYNPKLDLENYKYPVVGLLKKYPDNSPSVNMAEQNANKDRIITVLRNFGVEIKSIKATIGPTITLYEITPAPGVRISKIRNLEDDIALSLSALGIRIIAPIPGKGTIGIEVPNKNPRIVSMESIINTRKFQETTYDLPIALGKTITNEVFMVDLAKMPHLLVAGATGQGKSVGLNAIITSLLYKKHPSELKLVMVDPKKVEFSIYTPIENHFLAKIPDGEDPIITDVTKVVQTLKSLCQLMDHRYDLLRKAKVRNIKEYNSKFVARQLNPENGHAYMPYIVVIIDEFGDLIMTAGKEVELPIARIAQLARAVGMHMIIATQRPTTNIITGTIKANFPARMAFKVMSRIDSQTILDRTGANQLVGKGDMLFLSGNDPVRVQCAFVDTPEVEQICSYISVQQGYTGPFLLPEVASETDAAASAPMESGGQDPLFEEAARLIVIHQQGSTSLIQRKFSIGYNRAGRLMDQLERAGIVGPSRGAKPREVLCADETDLEMKVSAMR